MGTAISSPLNNSVWAVTVGRIMKVSPAQVLTLKEDDTVEKALLALKEHGVLSAPVVDKDGACRKGFFAMDDVIMHLSRICQRSVNATGSESLNIKTDQLEDLVVRQHFFHQEIVRDVISRHRGSSSQVLGIKSKKPIADALVVFANGVQRLAVYKRKAIVGILSQSTVIKWISENPKRLGDLADAPAESLGIPWKRVIKINKDALTIDCVQLMHDHAAYAVPVVDENDKLVCHCAMADFKYLALTDNFGDLLLPITEFISRVRKSHNQDPCMIVSANYRTPFKQIIDILVKEHMHHLYLLDDNNEPISMISLTNICHLVFHGTKDGKIE